MSALAEWWHETVDAHLREQDEGWEQDLAAEERRTAERRRLEERINLLNLMYYHTHAPLTP